jgi:hypothetical protein
MRAKSRKIVSSRDNGIAETFASMDAVLSGIKQIHVEAGPALAILAREFRAANGRRIESLNPASRESTLQICKAILEQLVDGLAFFSAIYLALQTGNLPLAGGVRLLVSLSTWTSRRQKTFSPWRALEQKFGPRHDAPSRLETWLALHPTVALGLNNALARHAWFAGFADSAPATYG